MLKSLITGVVLAALATPAIAQTQNKDSEGQKLDQTSMECAGAAMALPFLKKNMPKAEQDALTMQAEFWLGLAIELGKTVGADVSKDSEASAFRLLAQLDLVGTEPALAYYSKIQTSCNAIYVEFGKS